MISIKMNALAFHDTSAFMKALVEIPILSLDEEGQLVAIATRGRNSLDNLATLENEFEGFEKIPTRLLIPSLDAILDNIIAGEESEKRIIYHNLRFASW